MVGFPVSNDSNSSQILFNVALKQLELDGAAAAHRSDKPTRISEINTKFISKITFLLNETLTFQCNRPIRMWQWQNRQQKNDAGRRFFCFILSAVHTDKLRAGACPILLLSICWQKSAPVILRHSPREVFIGLRLCAQVKSQLNNLRRFNCVGCKVPTRCHRSFHGALLQSLMFHFPLEFN